MTKATIALSNQTIITGELLGGFSEDTWVLSKGRVFRGQLLNSWEVAAWAVSSL